MKQFCVGNAFDVCSVNYTIKKNLLYLGKPETPRQNPNPTTLPMDTFLHLLLARPPLLTRPTNMTHSSCIFFATYARTELGRDHLISWGGVSIFGKNNLALIFREKNNMALTIRENKNLALTFGKNNNLAFKL